MIATVGRRSGRDASGCGHPRESPVVVGEALDEELDDADVRSGTGPVVAATPLVLPHAAATTSAAPSAATTAVARNDCISVTFPSEVIGGLRSRTHTPSQASRTSATTSVD